MIINGMDDFLKVCKKQLVKQYNGIIAYKSTGNIDTSDVFVVWSCKTLQNYKALLSTNVSGDGVYVEYTYNGDKNELYEDLYMKVTNRCIKEA